MITSFFSNYKFTKNQREAVNCNFLLISIFYEYPGCLEAIKNIEFEGRLHCIDNTTSTYIYRKVFLHCLFRQSFQGYRCRSMLQSFAWRVTENYAYNPLKVCRIKFWITSSIFLTNSQTLLIVFLWWSL